MADDYKANLDKFFGLVPNSAAPTTIMKNYGSELHGEVLSGKPIIQVT